MKQYRDMIEVALKNWCEKAPEHLRKPLELALLSGGHRIRPILTLAWSEASGGRTVSGDVHAQNMLRSITEKVAEL